MTLLFMMSTNRSKEYIKNISLKRGKNRKDTKDGHLRQLGKCKARRTLEHFAEPNAMNDTALSKNASVCGG